MDRNKKLTLVGVLVALVVICIFFTIMVQNIGAEKQKAKEATKQTESQKVVKKEVQPVKEEELAIGRITEEVTLDQVKEKLKNKENFTLMLSQTQCPYCIDFITAINEKMDEGTKVYVLEADKLDKKALEAEFKVPKYTFAIEQILGMKSGTFLYTPMTSIFRLGVLTETMTEETEGNIDALKIMIAK